MNIHEYQAKTLLAGFGVACMPGVMITDASKARAAAGKLGEAPWAVKAQIHAGGRGKGGGIKLARSPDEVADAAKQMLGMQLVTPQTGPEGRPVRRLYIEQGCVIERELYLGLLIDRASGQPMFIASPAGGMDIEAVAAETPEKIHQVVVDPAIGFQPFHARRLASAFGLKPEQTRAAVGFFSGIYRAFTELDASLIEINPLVVDGEGALLALDAKVNFDDNALYRRPDILKLRDEDEEDPLEAEAASYELNYIRLDGSIGCMVNGAGLAMATMDIIQLYGGSPANFLDVGGGANAERVAAGFRLILSDPRVKAVLVNIFGGIMKCDVIAEGIVQAAQEVSLTVPLVVRLAGTNVDLGRKILEESDLEIIAADDLDAAAERAVAAAK